MNCWVRDVPVSIRKMPTVAFIAFGSTQLLFRSHKRKTMMKTSVITLLLVASTEATLRGGQKVRISCPVAFQLWSNKFN
jgi:hypothetical protein